MIRLLDAVVLGTSAAGVAAMMLALLLRVSWREGVNMALSLWVAAGLMRLSATRDWTAITASAGIIFVRQLVSFGLRRGGVS